MGPFLLPQGCLGGDRGRFQIVHQTYPHSRTCYGILLLSSRCGQGIGGLLVTMVPHMLEGDPAMLLCVFEKGPSGL